MMNKPDNTLTCWLLGAEEFADITDKVPFSPAYQPYLFFYITERTENNIEGHLGNAAHGPQFHDSWSTSINYFNTYRENRLQYITFDKVNFYVLAEILPVEPFLFILKKHQMARIVSPLSDPAAISATVHRLHFEELHGDDFERLVFAYVQRILPHMEIEWLGETGKDKGRDIWAKSAAGSHCFQCANYRELTLAKARGDIDSLVKNMVIPDALTVVCGGKVANKLRDQIKKYGSAADIQKVSVWSGSELEVKLREKAQDLILRFFGGVAFPEILGLENSEK